MKTLENEILSVHFSENTYELSITDKRIGKTWKQLPFPSSFTLTSADVCKNEMAFAFSTPFSFTLTIKLENENELLYTVHADAEISFEELAFPPAVSAPDEYHYILETDSEGFLLPVTDNGYPLDRQPIFKCSGGPGMAWLGMTDYELNSGYMCIYETPFDADILLSKVDGLISFSTIWLSSFERFAYDRKIRFIFFDHGGYIAQCKRYRSYAWKKNNVSTIRSRLDRFPNLHKILAAAHIYLWDDARNKEFLEELKNSGIDRALILWNPNHLPYPDKDFALTAKSLGYGIGNQELFTDIHPDTPERLQRKKELPLLLNCYPGQFEYLTAKPKNGGTYSNQFGNYVCPAAIRNEMQKRIDQTLEDYPEETLFLDVYQANGLYECYDERHPLTREGYAQSIIDNMKFIEEHYGMFVGSEFGADYGAGHGVYVYGMMTLQKTWFHSPAIIPGTIYYIGDWKNGRRPSIMLSTRTAYPEYHKYCLNEYTRIPLYELVYHDAVMTSWRWEDCNHQYPEVWWKKDLFNILYGNIPLWTLDKNLFNSYKTTFIDSYNNIIPWLKEICLDEMVSHEFLSEDHQIQKTSFSSGKSVIVNFSCEDRQYQNLLIPAHGYSILR